IELRMPRAAVGPDVTQLVATSLPLANIVAYANLVESMGYRETCVLAEGGGRVGGGGSGYRSPARPPMLSVWHRAVRSDARGSGVGLRMLDELVERPAAAGPTTLTTTITEDYQASWKLLHAFARRGGAALTKAPRFEREAHFARAHDTEFEARIPL